jgi:hypothetical protein
MKVEEAASSQSVSPPDCLANSIAPFVNTTGFAPHSRFHSIRGKVTRGNLADMKTIKTVLILAMLFTFMSFSAAAQQRDGVSRQSTPDALVADLYKQSGRNRGPFFQTKNRALLDKYFEKNLAGLIWKDALNARGEVGAIDGDPLYNAQDMEIKKFSIHPPRYENGKATVTVSFENFGQKQEILFSLVLKNAAWKIEDIKYNDGTSLVGILKGNEASFFEGRFRVGDTACNVKPVKMAFEVTWAKGKGVMMFFFDSAAPSGKPTYTSEDKGAGTDRFIFDDERFASGKFIRADGKEFPVTKIS